MQAEREYRALLARAGGQDTPAENPYDAVDAGIRRTLAASGVDVPPGIYVGEFPHGSLHAQARAVRGGTLILLDNGLRTLLDRMAGTLVASQLSPSRDEQGAARYESPALVSSQRQAEADAAFADAIGAYVSAGRAFPRARVDPGSFGFFMARSAERFVIGHEYGHLLAGHPHTPPSADPQAQRREYEADELAAMLILRGVDESVESRWRALAVAGPFLFLAIEQLVNGARGSADPDHPAPARRSELLRGIFEQAGARGLLHFAEAWVSSLSLRETAIVRRFSS